MSEYRYPTLDAWIIYGQLSRLNLEYDNYHLNTGEEGDAKSTWSRLAARRLDYLMRTPSAPVQLQKDGPMVRLDSVWRPTFPIPPPMVGPPSLDNVCFGQDSLLLFLATLAKYGIAIGDEVEGHRRLAMHGHRQVLLDHTKEARFYSHNVWLNYPHVDQFERDLFRTRLKWWEHQDRRGHVVIRERPRGQVMFDRDADVSVLVKWPIVAVFNWKNDNDPWKAAYEAKKQRRADERMKKRLEAMGVLDQLPTTQAVPKPAVQGPPAWLLDELQREIKKAP